MDNICRTCSRICDDMEDLFDSEKELPYKILIVSDVEIGFEDELPSQICKECVKNVNLCFNFRKVIQSSDHDLKERLTVLKSQTSTDQVNLNNDDVNEIEIVTLQNIKLELGGSNLIEENCKTSDPQDRRLKTLITYKKKTFKCTYCDFTTTNNSLWRNHKRAKQCNRKVCNVCGKTFRTDNLLKHIRTHSELPIECPQCKKVFKNKESLRGHQFLHRNEEFVCQVCGKSYKIRGEYNRHLNSHDPNRERKVKCTLCDKTFYDTKHIRSHMLSHSGERPHVCQYCQKGFVSSYTLKVHLRQHTDERPYMCLFCPMAFLQKVSLKNHLKTRHPSNSQGNVAGIDIKLL